MPLLAGADAYHHDGGPVGALLCHGFTGTPQSLRPWAEHLAQAGLSVSLPLLPGHGTRWQDMNRTTWSDWYGAVDLALTDLLARCEQVVVMGLSMGGTLALRLAELRGPDVTALVLVNPSVRGDHKALPLLPLLKHLMPSVGGVEGDVKKPGVDEVGYHRTPLRALASLTDGWRAVRTDLARVTQPVLIFRSRTDHIVGPRSTALVLSRISSTIVMEQVLEDSFHVATLDHDAPRIFTGSLEFVAQVTQLLSEPMED